MIISLCSSLGRQPYEASVMEVVLIGIREKDIWLLWFGEYFSSVSVKPNYLRLDDL